MEVVKVHGAGGSNRVAAIGPAAVHGQSRWGERRDRPDLTRMSSMEPHEGR